MVVPGRCQLQCLICNYQSFYNLLLFIIVILKYHYYPFIIPLLFYLFYSLLVILKRLCIKMKCIKMGTLVVKVGSMVCY